MDETMTTTTKNATSRKPAEKKAATPAPVAEVPKKATRADLLARLDHHKYAGPRSYTAGILGDVADWLDAGAPIMGSIATSNAEVPEPLDLPDGVLFTVHPELRPASAPKAKTLSKTYIAGRRDALVEVGSLMQGKDASVAALRSWLLEQVEAIAENGEATV